MNLRELLTERNKQKRVSMAYTCSVDAFRRNAKKLQKEGYPPGLAYAQAYSALAYACGRVRRDAETILTAPNIAEELTSDDLILVAKGLMESLLS